MAFHDFTMGIHQNPTHHLHVRLLPSDQRNESVLFLNLVLLHVDLLFESRILDNILQWSGDPRMKRLEVLYKFVLKLIVKS